MGTWTQQITVDGFDCLLVLPPINWRKRPRVTHTFFDLEAEGRTGIESRAPEAAGMLLSFEYLYTLKQDIAQEIYDELTSLGTEQRIAVPIWPDQRNAADFAGGNRVYSASHWINLNPKTGAYSVDGDDGHPLSLGLAVCSLLDRPRLTLRTDQRADLDVRLEEDSPWASRVDVHELVLATWDFKANWSNAPEVASRWQLQRRRVGQGRISARVGTLGATKELQSAPYRFKGVDAIRKALTFWRDHCGPTKSFTMRKFFEPNGTESTLQARFADESLTLEYALPDEARATIQFRQDLLLIGGQPTQDRPPRAYLYRVQWKGATTVFAWTDWAVPYMFSGVTYQPGIVEHKASTETMKPGQSDWELLVYDFDGNPLRAFGRLARERQLMLQIFECNPNVANTAAMIFDGEIKSAPNRGTVYTAKAALFGGAFRALIPQTYCQQGCNNTLGDALCGVDIEALRVDGAIEAINGTVVDVTCASAEATDRLALGFVQLGAGDDLELRFVLRSEPISGGQRLTLHRPLWTSVVGTTLSIYPGCDQQFEGGCARYNNQPNFFGAPNKVDYMESVDSGFRTRIGK